MRKSRNGDNRNYKKTINEHKMQQYVFIYKANAYN